MMEFSPGIYFQLNESDYHSVPALSNSGIKWLLVSPMDFWARCRWLNPDYEHKTTEAMDMGSAYHARVVEGRKAFYERYAAELDPKDHPEALRSHDDLKAGCKDRGLPVSGNKPDLTERLQEADPELEFWETLLAGHADKNDGKILLGPSLFAKIEREAAMIEMHPELSKALTGGRPEVSVFWVDAETSTPMKCRFDYLKVKAVVDFKTFSNSRDLPVDMAISLNFAQRRYQVQVATYIEGAAHIPGLFKRGLVFGEVDAGWLSRVAKNSDKEFYFIFQQTGVAPIAKGRHFPKGEVYDDGKRRMRRAQQLYADCLQHFGTDPWVDPSPITAFSDEDFPAWVFD